MKVVAITTVMSDSGVHTEVFKDRETAKAVLRGTLEENKKYYERNIGIDVDDDIEELLDGLFTVGHLFPSFTADEYYVFETELK